MSFSWNPFYRVIESKENQASRLFRRTFFEKVKDTLFIIAGNRGFFTNKVALNDREDITHPGLLDYVSFQVTRMINKIALWSWRNGTKDPLAILVVIPASIAFFALNTTHYAISLSLTLVALPFIGITHLVSQMFGGNALKNDAKKLEGNTNGDYKSKNMKDKTLDSFMKAFGHSYSDIIMDLEIKRTASQLESANQQLYPLSSARADNESDNHLLVMTNHQKYECCIGGKCTHQRGHIEFEVDLDHLQPNDKPAIQALLKLNAGRLRDNLEANGYLQAVEKMVSAAP